MSKGAETRPGLLRVKVSHVNTHSYEGSVSVSITYTRSLLKEENEEKKRHAKLFGSLTNSQVSLPNPSVIFGVQLD